MVLETKHWYVVCLLSLGLQDVSIGGNDAQDLGESEG